MEINKEELIKQAKAIPPQEWERFGNSSGVVFDAKGFSVCSYYKPHRNEFGELVWHDDPYYVLLYNGNPIINNEKENWWAWLFELNPAYQLFQRLKRFHDKQQ